MAQIKEKETTDEIIAEMRNIKKALAKSMDFDIDRILQDAKQKQNQGGRKILPPPVKQSA